MNVRHNRRGFTLLEILIGVVFLGIIVLAIVSLFSKSTPFLKRAQARQTAMLQSRTCMDLIVNRLRNGKARTLIISTPAVTPVVPNSQVQFSLVSKLPSGANSYIITLNNGTVYTQEPPSVTQVPLVSNVTGLKFSGSATDPAAVYVSLRMDVPWDSSGDPTHVSSIFLQNQLVHMVEVESP